MRATTRVPEPPVAPITNGWELATPTLATTNAAEQYPRCRDFTISMKSSRAIVFFAWGADYVDRVATCIRESRLPQLPTWLMTDSGSDLGKLPTEVKVVRADFQLSGKARKTEMFARLPQEIETALVLDADTRVIDDISFGFEQAEKHGIAIVPAPHYSLADFLSFREVMLKEGVTPRGQMIYNSGVLFSTPHPPDVRAVLELTLKLAKKYDYQEWSDQHYLSLAMQLP